ncbi:MAG: hypothetical protein ABIR24_07025 [Verrucomicrobiota bacterium]
MKRLHSIWQPSFLLLAGVGWFCSAGNAAVLLSQNFDGVVAPAIPAGWTVGTNNVSTNSAILWKTSINFADTLPNAIFAVDQTNVSDSFLISPTVLITTTNAQLTFRHKYDLESGGAYYDGGILEVSANGGTFTNIITVGGSFLSNGYVGTIETNFNNPLAGQFAWSGNSGGFITTIAKLPASANGNQVRLRWRCGTDSTVGATGWYVDSISLTDGSDAGPTITSIFRNGNNVNFSFATVTGQNYTVEYKNSLGVSNWTTLQSVVGDGTTKLISDSILASPQRFYRVKSP